MLTIKEERRVEVVEKKSRFIGILCPCQSLQECKRLQAALKHEFADSRHLCFAFRVLDQGNLRSRFSDDGEPSGSAGKPIYNFIEGSDLVNVAVFVVRYFGGVKLGVGGLVRAYGGVTRELIHKSELQDFEIFAEMTLTVALPQFSAFLHKIGEFSGEIRQRRFDESAHVVIAVPQSKVTEFHLWWKEFSR